MTQSPSAYTEGHAKARLYDQAAADNGSVANPMKGRGGQAGSRVRLRLRRWPDGFVATP